MQKNILEAYPDVEMEVHAVWLPMVFGDKFPRLKRATGTLPDKRVTHFWDKNQEVGLWFKQNVTTQYPGKVLWDASLLFGPGATWEEVPQPLVFFGRTIIQDAEKLRTALDKMIKQP